MNMDSVCRKAEFPTYGGSAIEALLGHDGRV